MHLVLLAAGRGTRLPIKFRQKPKCLAEINGRPILDYNINFYNKFSSKFIVTGFKKKKLHTFCLKNKFKKIENIKFKNTNMVHSLFTVSKLIKKDIVICYGDIIFDENIYKILSDKKNINIMPIYKNWLNYWKMRMPIKKIKDDAENIEIKGNNLISIGEKIKKIFPKYQYMGIFKLKRRSFFKLQNFYKKLNDKKIDMTSFLNLAIKKKIIKFKIKKYESFWFEIDNHRDIKVASKGFK